MLGQVTGNSQKHCIARSEVGTSLLQEDEEGMLNSYFELVLAIKRPIFDLNLTHVGHLTDSDLPHG